MDTSTPQNDANKVIFADAPTLSAVRAVASAIVRTQDLHPNLLRLLTVVARYAGDTGKNELDDVGLFLENLKKLDPTELKVSLQVLAVACVVDERLTSREENCGVTRSSPPAGPRSSRPWSG